MEIREFYAANKRSYGGLGRSEFARSHVTQRAEVAPKDSTLATHLGRSAVGLKQRYRLSDRNPQQRERGLPKIAAFSYAYSLP